jgi:hypothetical protein
VYYYAASTLRPDLFGSPEPRPGARVVFDEARLHAYGPRRYFPVVHQPGGPQGLAVFWSPLDVLTWPCRLWRVEDLAQPTAVSTHPFYLRCAAFTVIDEQPSWQVFGPHGEAVAHLEDQAAQLTSQHVSAIATADGIAEWQAFRDVMRRWHAQVDSTPHEGRLHSPIGNGLAVVRDAVDLAAARTGAQLFSWVEDTSESPVLADPAWREARQAMAAAALAAGAPELLQNNDAEALTSRWQHAL